MEQRRLLTFLVLSILSIYLYFNVLTRVYGPMVPETPPGTHDLPLQREPVQHEPAAAPGPKTRQEAAAVPIPEGRSVVIENDVLRSVWTSTGARLKSMELKRYRSAVVADSPPLELIERASMAALPGELEILPQGFRDTRVDYSFDKATLHVTGADRGRLVFRGKGPNGLSIEKEIGVEGDSYLLSLTIRARGPGAGAVSAARVSLTRGLGDEDGSGGGWFSGGGSSRKFHGVLVLNGRHLEQVAFKSLKRKALAFDEARWGGFGDQYFIQVLLSGGAPAAKVLIPQLEAATPAAVRMEVPLAPDTREATLGVYFGPKDVDVLERSGGGLKRAIDFGMFWFIAAPLLQLLKLVHTVTTNYGFDIIIVSVLIKLAFLPLTQKSMVSMQAMQKLQPQMAKLKERYKGEPQEMQKQIAELYRRHHVNPISGCLPMLLQFPVFIGLYNTLRNAIELRHAPFIFWVTDLSAPERMMIGGVGVPVLAAIMGVSMLVQQWMTPSTGDSTQRMMMMLMPVVFTFMFINFPSGLVLYWLVNNVLTIMQQYFLVNRPTGHTGGN